MTCKLALLLNFINIVSVFAYSADQQPDLVNFSSLLEKTSAQRKQQSAVQKPQNSKHEEPNSTLHEMLRQNSKISEDFNGTTNAEEFPISKIPSKNDSSIKSAEKSKVAETVWQIHVHLNCPENCDHNYVKISKWAKELIKSNEFAKSKYRFKTLKLSATHCNCKMTNNIAVELYINRTEKYPKKNCSCFDGDTNSKIEFWNFMRRHHRLPREFKHSLEFEELLDNLSVFKNQSIVLFYNEECETSEFYQHSMDLSSIPNIDVYKLRYPLKLNVEAEVKYRLEYPPNECQLLLLNGGAYSWLPTETNKATVMRYFQNNEYSQVTPWKKINESLTEMQKSFGEGEIMSERHIWKPTCILVGTSGGIAVIALAVSIFWGLNGSSFTAN